MAGFESQEELLKFYQESRTLMKTGGFNLRSWASNCDTLNKLAKSQNVHDGDTSIRVLGLRWKIQDDSICFGHKTLPCLTDDTMTKREILRRSSKIYDPLGLLSPITIRSKIFLQDLWSRKLGWDETIPNELKLEWFKLSSDLYNCQNIEFPRRYFEDDMNTETTLHVFTDSSKVAYGACVYLVKGDESTLVMAKTRVAPLKKLTIPQLKLMDALIGARLSSHILNSSHNVSKCIMWSDSQIVLHWINSKKQLKVFIANRISEIKKLTQEHKWQYCPTECNPADLLSRGLSYESLKSSTLWRNGPEWLKNQTKWPRNIVSGPAILVTSENENAIGNSQETTQNPSNVLNIVDKNKYSTFRKVVHIVAYMQRFIRNCRVGKVNRRTT